MRATRQQLQAIFTGKGTHCGAFWTGHFADASLLPFAQAYGSAPTREALAVHLHDPCRWIWADNGYIPQRNPFDPSWGLPQGRGSLSAPGCFANVETTKDIERYPWPTEEDYDFTAVYQEIQAHSDHLVFTGMWSPFFHILSDFFGMENYFIQMHDNPAVVDAATELVVDCLVRANERFFLGLGQRADVLFFGNDLGTQRDLMLSPALFRRFVLPSIKRIVDVGKRYGKFVVMHACGSIARVIPDLIEIGVDALHPIQAQAAGMDAVSLSRYKNDLAFIGGVDAQRFFVTATPAEIRAEVFRVADILGPNWIVSPSHEEILPNIPPENLLAMVEAARSLSC